MERQILDAPLSKREWTLYKDLKQIFLNNKDIAFDLAEFHRYEDWLMLLKDKGVIWTIRADGAFLCGLNTNFDDFELWIKDIDKKAKKLNNREWKIAIVSAIIGALIGLIPFFIQLSR